MTDLQNPQRYYVTDRVVDIKKIVNFAREIKTEVDYKQKTIRYGPDEVKIPPVIIPFSSLASK